MVAAFAAGCALLAFAPRALPAETTSPLEGSGYLVRGWSTGDGLPENSATAVAQTRDGYLWIGTWKGLARYNGDKFTTFHPANTPQLPAEGIVNLHADRCDRLWVSTMRGLVVKEGDQWRLLGTSEGWAGNHVRTFSERADGDLLITTFDGHVLVFANGQLTELPRPPGEPGQGYVGAADENGRWWLVQNRFVGYWDGQRWAGAHQPDPSVGRSAVACTAARDGGVWVLLATELLKFRGSELVFRTSLPQVRGGIWTMVEDSRANLWICSYDSGLFQLTAGGVPRHWTGANDLGTLATRSVFEDHEENLWIGTNGDGLKRLTRLRFHAPHGGQPGSQARSVAPARDGGVWVAMYDGGLSRQDEKGSTRIAVPGPTNVTAYGLSVLEDRAGRLWYGDEDHCWVRRGQNHFEKVPLKPAEGAGVRALFEDAQGRIWIGTRKGAVVYDGGSFVPQGPEVGLPDAEVTSFGQDASGAIWVAMVNDVFRREKDRFTAVRGGERETLQGVLCFHARPDGAMWMGTRAAALIRWRDGRLNRIGVGQGFPRREVRGIIEDGQGYLWMPSNRGIIRTSHPLLEAVADGAGRRLQVQLLDEGDGLPSAECFGTQPNCARDTAGRLWFATQKGVAVTDPEGFRLNARPPPVQVEQLTYHTPTGSLRVAEPLSPAGSGSGEVRLRPPFPAPIRLPPGPRGLEIEFAALSFPAPEKVRFQYQLEGNGRGWQDAGSDRKVVFHQLPPGAYIFRVRAANNDGVWNEAGASLAFSVLPFFWQTSWFRLAAALMFVAAGGVAVWSWSHRKMARALERERAARALHASQVRLEAGSELARLGYYEVDYAAQTCFLDDRFREICGVPAEVTNGMEPAAFWLEHLCPEDRQRIVDERRRLHEGETDQLSAEYRYLHPVAGERWLQHNARIAERRAGGIRTFGVVRDITETRRTAEKLEEDSRYANLIADLSSRFVNLPPGAVDSEIEDAQRRVCEFLDLDLAALWQPVEEVPGDYRLTHHYRAMAGPPITRMSARDNFPWCQQQLLAGKLVAVSAMDKLPPEAARDREVWCHFGIQTSLTLPLATGGNSTLGFLSFNDIRKEREWPQPLVQRLQLVAQIFTNALARKRSDEGLRESAEVNRATFEQAAVGIAHVAPDGRWLRVNDKLCAIVGYSREELMRSTFQDITHPDDVGSDLDHWRRMLAGETNTCSTEKRYFRKDGSLVQVNLSVSLVRTERGEPKYFISVMEDITERKRAEEEMQRLRLHLWHADRVAQTGAITASLAHELNQPMTGILSTAQAGLRFLTGGNTDPALIHEILTHIVQDTKRAGTIINGLRAMLRRKETQREPISLPDTIREILGLVHGELVGRQVECRLRLEADPEVVADKAQIQQVLLNLVMNAVEAMHEQPPELRRVEVTLDLGGTGEAKVAVRDSGPGIPQAEQEKLFAAFYTTKEHGMGIGLAISYSIIESHGGRLWCANHPDGGAVFSFTLPVAAGEGTGAEAEAPQ